MLIMKMKMIMMMMIVIGCGRGREGPVWKWELGGREGGRRWITGTKGGRFVSQYLE